MNQAEIKKEVKHLIDLSVEGHEIENPKVDFKREWYNLIDRKGKSEFLKDVTAIANTVGLDGYIIIGFDEKVKSFYDAKFSDSGLKDNVEINGIISKNVDGLLTVNHYDIKLDKHSLSIIHIPPSYHKPHVIRNYINKKGNEYNHSIFIRRNSGVGSAAKSDIDLMYYDRQNQLPEYSFEISSHIGAYNFHRLPNDYLGVSANLTIENTGSRPLSIHEIELMLKGQKFNNGTSITFTSEKNILEKSGRQLVKVNNLLINSNAVTRYTHLYFLTNLVVSEAEILAMDHNKIFITELKATVKLSSGHEFSKWVRIIK